MKVCPACGVEQALEEFYKKKDGRYHCYCISCNRKKSREWRAANPERRRQNLRDWHAANPTWQRQYHRKYQYGLSPEDYASLIAKQRGLCRICQEPMEQPCVDHDHTTGKVRGLLCGLCNRGLGQFRDSPFNLLGAIDYLEAA